MATNIDSNKYNVATDVPLVLSPEAEKAKLVSYVADKRWRIETGGFVLNGISVPSDDRAKLLIMGAAGSMEDTDTADFVVNGAAITLTGLHFRAMYAEIIRRVKSLFSIQASILAKIDDGTITTKEQIDQENWTP